MIFVAITFFTAFLIEGLGSMVSIIGLSTLFGANLIIIALAIALDLGKLTIVTLLYKHWSALSKIMRTYALIAAAVTMTITSAGAAGYLSGEFQKAIIGTQEVSVKVNTLKSQIAKYEDRKRQIDEQISKLPEKTTVSQRLHLISAFGAEQKELQLKINKIDQELPLLQVNQIGVEAKAGPILYMAKAFNISVETAIAYVIMLIIFVFDPLAVFLIIAGNFLLEAHQRKSMLMPKVLPERNSPELIDTVSPSTQVLVAPDTHQVALSAELNNSIIEPESTPLVTPNATEQKRETITLGSIRQQGIDLVPHASLGDIRADDTVTFDNRL